MDEDRLGRLRDELRAFVEEREWRKFHDPKNLAMLVASEAGELAGVMRWVRNDEADAAVQVEPLRTKLAHEIGDVALGLVLLCDRVGLDLVDVARAKLAKNRANYPADQVRGSAERPPREE